MIRRNVYLKRFPNVRYVVLLKRRNVLYVNLCGDVNGIGMIVP